MLVAAVQSSRAGFHTADTPHPPFWSSSLERLSAVPARLLHVSGTARPCLGLTRSGLPWDPQDPGPWLVWWGKNRVSAEGCGEGINGLQTGALMDFPGAPGSLDVGVLARSSFRRRWLSDPSLQGMRAWRSGQQVTLF